MLLDDIARWMYCIQSNIAFIWMDGVVRWVGGSDVNVDVVDDVE